MAASIREAFVGWLFSMASSANKKANLAKAATLKIYDCQLSWTDPKVITSGGQPASVVIGTSVITDSEHRAREMSQERANKETPVITAHSRPTRSFLPTSPIPSVHLPSGRLGLPQN